MDIFALLEGLFWLILAFFLLIVLQRALHREIQAVFLILTRRPVVTQVIFALIFFPGVLLHELSHFLMAKLLGVRTGRFSLIPRAMDDGRLQLGAVETVSGGVVRDALIGAAPLISGCLFVAMTAIFRMRLLPLWDVLRRADWEAFWRGVGQVPASADFWLWFYLAFAVSSTMMPSASDRHAWRPVGLTLAILVGLALLAGAGAWMLQNLAPPVFSLMQALALILGLSGLIHLFLLPPLLLSHRVLTKITGVDVG